MLKEDLDELEEVELADDEEPTEEELIEYAEYVGIDLETEPHLIYLAEEGLLAKLPSGWKLCRNKTGDFIYYCSQTGQVS